MTDIYIRSEIKILKQEVAALKRKRKNLRERLSEITLIAQGIKGVEVEQLKEENERLRQRIKEMS